MIVVYSCSDLQRIMLRPVITNKASSSQNFCDACPRIYYPSEFEGIASGTVRNRT